MNRPTFNQNEVKKENNKKAKRCEKKPLIFIWWIPSLRAWRLENFFSWATNSPTAKFLNFWAVVKDIASCSSHVWLKFQFKSNINLVMRCKSVRHPAREAKTTFSWRDARTAHVLCLVTRPILCLNIKIKIIYI